MSATSRLSALEYRCGLSPAPNPSRRAVDLEGWEDLTAGFENDQESDLEGRTVENPPLVIALNVEKKSSMRRRDDPPLKTTGAASMREVRICRPK